MKMRISLLILVFLSVAAIAGTELPRIEVDKEKRGFCLAGTERGFVPWGFNYDRDYKMRLIEDYWDAEWETVASDFREMKELGANVVRVHLQFAKFMRTATEPEEKNLRQLAKLLALAEETGLYLDVTGLGCYHKADVPAWYDALDEAGRWEAQARFWEAVAEVGAKSGAVFCYDLMNEPVVAAGKSEQWLGPAFGGKHYVQYITRDSAGRERAEVGRRWVEKLSRAIRKKDAKALITVGLVDWSLERPGLTSGMVPSKIAAGLDFVCVHLYPRTGKLEEDLATLAGFAAAGKPVVIEETFPLFATAEEFSKFLAASSKDASGWMGFYWGQTMEELGGKEPGEVFTKAWLEIFKKGAPAR